MDSRGRSKEYRSDESRRYRERNLEKIKERDKLWSTKNKKQLAETRKKYYRENPVPYLYRAAKARSKKFGYDFNIDQTDLIVPEFCPVLGIPIEVSGAQRNNSPSIDRIDNSKGYVKGNVKVISWRANNIKSDATLKELEAIVQYIKENT